MKERCFVFKLVDHDKKTTRVIEALVYDNKVMEWLHTENKEEYAKWLTRHILWEKQLKKHVKDIIIRQRIGELVQTQTGGKFGDYRVVKKITKKEYAKVNMNKNANEPFLERKMKYEEKYIIKLERGQKSVEWPETLRYPQTFEHYMFLLESNELDNNIKIKEIGNKVTLNDINIEHAKKTSNQNLSDQINTQQIQPLTQQNTSVTIGSTKETQTGGRNNERRQYRKIY